MLPPGRSGVSTVASRGARELAVFGGAPAFDQQLHVGRPNLGDRGKLMARMEQIIESRWLSNGGCFERELEQRVCEILGVQHCVATCNATVALEILTRALNLSGEVIVPSFTFVATAHALEWQGIRPVFCDIDARTHNIDPAEVEALVTDRTTAILGVHLWGRPCAIDELQGIADRHNLALIFDAAHAFGSRYHGLAIGNFGRAEVLSFHATKFVNSAEGGAVVTNDAAVAQGVRLMRSFGFAGYDRVISLGTNGKLSEPCAAIGLTNLEAAETFRAVNKANFTAYAEGLSGIPGIRLLEYAEECCPSYHYVVVEIDERQSGLDRDTLVAVLHAENVLARRYFYPGAHRMEPYRSTGATARELPQTEAVGERVMVLPTGTSVSASDIALICETVRIAVTRCRDVAEMFQRTGNRAASRDV